MTTYKFTKLSPMLRADHSPKFLSIKMTIHGAALVVRGGGKDTLVRIGSGDFYTAYLKAVEILMEVHGTQKRTDRLVLTQASRALLRRCGYKLHARTIHEVHPI